jgi:alkanesulfonate monooxygenase SsuD/methylene tetrahydromethanopterin reductase-like flavin-dependent oxidoreductase (luciferase family)
MHLGLFTYPGGHHIAGWRHGSVDPTKILGYDYYRQSAVLAERGKFDLFFIGDMLAAREKDGRVIAQGALNNIDSISIASALAGATEHLGLVATLSTTYNEPFAIAERFASLDHISAGRAGWNVITTANDDAAYNFSRKSHMEKSLRYERAKEFVDICKGLWDGWDEDALMADRKTGVFVDPQKVRTVDHQGQFFTVRGALEQPRPPQGLACNGPGWRFARGTRIRGDDRRADLRRAEQSGRSVKVPFGGEGADAGSRARPGSAEGAAGLLPILGSTEAEALAKEKMLNELLHPAVGIWMLSEQMNFRLYDYPQEGPLPTADIRSSGSNFSPRVVHLMARADREGLSVRDCGVLVAASRSHGSFVGTPDQLVDHMKLWMDEGACDGFNIMPAYFQDELELFVDQAVPLLRRRGLFRTDYTGTTLRDNLGLPVPPRVFS